MDIMKSIFNEDLSTDKNDHLIIYIQGNLNLKKKTTEEKEAFKFQKYFIQV